MPPKSPTIEGRSRLESTDSPETQQLKAELKQAQAERAERQKRIALIKEAIAAQERVIAEALAAEEAARNAPILKRQEQLSGLKKTAEAIKHNFSTRHKEAQENVVITEKPETTITVEAESPVEEAETKKEAPWQPFGKPDTETLKAIQEQYDAAPKKQATPVTISFANKGQKEQQAKLAQASRELDEAFVAAGEKDLQGRSERVAQAEKTRKEELYEQDLAQRSLEEGKRQDAKNAVLRAKIEKKEAATKERKEKRIQTWQKTTDLARKIRDGVMRFGRKHAATAAVTAVLSSIPENNKISEKVNPEPQKVETPVNKEFNRFFDTSTFTSDYFKKKTEEAEQNPNHVENIKPDEPKVELPPSFGKLEQYMDMEFFNSEVKKDSAFQWEYLNWAEESLESKGKETVAPLPEYNIVTSKSEARTYIIDRKGHPVMAFNVILGREHGDNIEIDHSAAGRYKIEEVTNPEYQASFHGKLYEVVGAGREAIHDTIYYTDAKQPDNSKQQEEALKSKTAAKRRLSNGCFRWPGLVTGKYDKYLQSARFTVLPEESTKNKICIINPEGKKELLTKQEYMKLLRNLITRHK